MPYLTESEIELLAIQRLEGLKYQYLHGGVIAPDGVAPERSSYEEVLLVNRLKESLLRINPEIPEPLIQQAVKEIQRIGSSALVDNNETFHRYLTEGIPVTRRIAGEERGDLVWLIDFQHPSNNDFLAVNQFTVVENHQNRRPDLVLFINGIPMVVMELKNAADDNATIRSAFRQIETYQLMISKLFTFNVFNIISDGLEAKVGSISADFSRYMAWKTSDGISEAPTRKSQLETLIQGLLRKDILMDYIRNFVVFENAKKEDPNTHVITVVKTKKIAAYHQYYAVNKAVISTLRAAGYQSDWEPALHLAANEPENYGLPGISTANFADRKAGVVWHTQGSGKSLSMVFYTGKIVQQLNNPTIVVITDRNDLDDQLFDTFSASKQLLRQEPVQAENRDHLKELLKVSAGGVVFATIQKFQPDEGNVYEMLSNRTNIVVIADEAHRTQYGFRAKTIDARNSRGEVIGKKVVYGFAKYMREALPMATYLGFTGTPIESTDINTPAVFGNYVDIYDIAQAVEDKATVRIFYASRLAKVALSDEGKQLIRDLDEELERDEVDEDTNGNTSLQKSKAKWTQLEALVGGKNRVINVAKDIVEHFQQRQEVFAGKGMIVTMSRRIAVELYDAIIALKPEWHSDELTKGAIKIVMTSASSDGARIAKHHTSKYHRRILADRMKNPDDELKLVIVRDMWLTGFDVPCLHTMYLDKPMKGHNLMQAIARVNRVYKDKPAGLIVDYLGIAADLKNALSFYADSGGKGDPTNLQEDAVALMLEKLEVVSQMFHDFPYEDYFDAGTSRKLSIILEAEEHTLGLENGKKRYIQQVTALSRAHAIAIPHPEAMDAKDEIAFFQAVKARLVKFDPSDSGRTDEEMETTIKQVIDQALVSEQVVDVFDAAGIKKPDISILSEDFLMELRGLPQKRVALEVLRKLLQDEISSRSKKNLVKSKSLMEMLEDSIRRYTNKILTAAEVIEELIHLSKEIVQMDAEAQQMGLSDFEYAFYSAVAGNASARELMQQDTLRELAVVLTETVRKNATIDWTIKESVKAKLKVSVKRILRMYGYPPDMQLLATETVLKQAEMIANELAEGM